MLFRSESFERLKNEDYKSINIKTLDLKEYNILEIPSIKRRVFLDSDYSILFEEWEKELQENEI